MSVDKNALLLYAITDRSWLNGQTLEYQVRQALEGGATIIQLREKMLDTNDYIKEAQCIKKITDSFNVPLIINDNIEVAIKSNASGVHLGQSDTGILEARKILGDNMIIGATAKTVEQALAAQNQGADYIGVGAVFGSLTKTNAIKITIDKLSEIAACVNIPAVAIGGISKENISNLFGSGISGVAVVSAVFAGSDIKGATAKLFAETQKIVRRVKTA